MNQNNLKKPDAGKGFTAALIAGVVIAALFMAPTLFHHVSAATGEGDAPAGASAPAEDKTSAPDDADAPRTAALVGGGNGLVIRGGTCSADAFKNGSGVSVIPPGSDNIFDLSVNCTTATSNKADYAQYTTGIPNTNFCVATIQDLERVGAKIVADRLDDNRYHCLVSGNAKKIATKLTRYPM